MFNYKLIWKVSGVSSMEMFVLMIIILMSAITVTYAGEIWLYVTLTVGSMIKQIQSKVKKRVKKVRK
jgi:hypothetical protein